MMFLLKFSRIRFIFFIIATILISSCGGGSDGGNPDVPTALIPQASIDSSNVHSFVSKLGLSITVGLTTEVSKNLSIQNVNGNSFDGQVMGCLNGTALFSLTDDGNGNVTGSGSYNEYENCIGLTLTGNTSLNGTMTGNTINTLNYNFSDLSYTKTGSTIKYRMSGKLALTWKPSVAGSAGYIMTIDANIFDGSGEVVSKLENFIIDSDISAGTQSLLITGRLYDLTHGYIDVSTQNRFQFYIPGEVPWTGEFSLSGKDNVAIIKYASGNYSVSFNPKSTGTD